MFLHLAAYYLHANILSSSVPSLYLSVNIVEITASIEVINGMTHSALMASRELVNTVMKADVVVMPLIIAILHLWQLLFLKYKPA